MAPEPLPSSSTPAPRPSLRDRVSRSARRARNGGSGDDQRTAGSVGAGQPQTGTFWWLGGKGTVSQQYGNASSRYASGAHDGLDIAVPLGTKVAALTDGEVVFAGDAGADGMRVGIRMDNGKTYYYGHLSTIGVKVGDRVGRGQQVAAAGSTGNSTGPHVHLELDRESDGGQGESPMAFLARQTGGKVQPGFVGSGGGGKNGDLIPAATAAGAPLGEVSTTFSRKELAKRYGYSAKFYDKIPGLDKFLDQAVKEQWTEDEAAARFMDTKWYRTHSDAEKAWTVLQTQRPGEAKRQREERYNAIQQLYREMGVPLTPERLSALTKQSLIGGWNADEIRDAVAAEFEFDPNAQFGGEAGQSIDNLRQMAGDYLVPLSDKTLGQWTENILRGEADTGSFETFLKTQAKTLLPEMADAIDRGITPSQYMDPYRELAARELEISPEDVDWTANKWATAAFQTDEKGGRRVMGLADWQKTLRTDPKYGYDKTSGAKDAASQFAARLTRTLGASA